jgi:small subunit ribosomal protein S3
MSRVESYRDGKIPLGTFRANIESGFSEAKTTYGRIGVKCLIYKGDSVVGKSQEQSSTAGQTQASPAAPPFPRRA